MNIVIAGDSWSQGEWSIINGDYKNTHRGLEKYLLDAGYNVINVGCGGNTNNQSLESLENELLSATYDYCIFFFTDALRQISQFELTNDEPYNVIHSHINYVINKLNYLIEKFQLKFIIIGGNAEFNPVQPHYATHIVSNMVSLLDPKFINLPYSQSVEWVQLLATNPTLSVVQKEQWTEIIKNSNLIADQRRNSNWFADGNHPNRESHKILFDHLLSVLK